MQQQDKHFIISCAHNKLSRNSDFLLNDWLWLIEWLNIADAAEGKKNKKIRAIIVTHQLKHLIIKTQNLKKKYNYY